MLARVYGRPDRTGLGILIARTDATTDARPRFIQVLVSERSSSAAGGDAGFVLAASIRSNCCCRNEYGHWNCDSTT
jgi:hypothetical protein